MKIEIQEVKELPEAISMLAQQANKEGFEFVTRMIEEFESGKNRFDKPNEFLLMAYDNGQLIGCFRDS